MQISEGRMFQAEGTASAKAGAERHVLEIARKLG